MENNKLEILKNSMHQGMISDFERDGSLAPILFFLKGDDRVVGSIPSELLSSYEGKQILATVIKKICEEPDVIAAGIIFEAYGVKLDKNDKLIKLVENGNIRVSELKEKKDIIMMIFSTPEGEEFFAYEVDPANKRVREKLFNEEVEFYGGTFSRFFKWNKNNNK